MEQVPDLTRQLGEGILLLGPGFLALKIFYLFGAQRPRSQWEWTTWSLLASVPVIGAAAVLAPSLANAVPADVVAAEVALRFVVAIVGALFLARVWRSIRTSRNGVDRWLREQVTDSAWDTAHEDAALFDRKLELLMKDGAEYRGHLRWGGREDTGAEGWLYLKFPRRKVDGTFQPIENAHGIMVLRDDVRRATFYRGPVRIDPDTPEQSAAGQGPP